MGRKHRAGVGRQPEAACSSSSAARAPNIVFDDANLAAAINGSRVRDLPQPGPGLHRRLAADAAREDRRRVPREVPRAGASRSGWATRSTPTTEMGPLTVALHRDRVLAYVRRGARAGRRDPDRRQARPSAASWRKGCYVEPTDRARAEPHRPRLPGRSVRPVRHRDHVQATRRGDWPSPTAPTTAWAAACGPRTCSARTAWRAACAPAWSGSTATSASTPARRSAASASRLRSRDGLRGDARVHGGEERVGQRRRADPWTLRTPRLTPFVYVAHPTARVIFGAGALAQLGPEIERLGATRALVLSTPSRPTARGASPRCWARAPRACSPRP